MTPAEPKSRDPGLGSLFEPVSEPMAQVRGIIDELLHDTDSAIQALSSGLRLGSGKMIRPGLVLLCGRATGAVRQDHLIAAAMVELIHTATLLHDDVIDCAQERRGRPSVNELHGNTLAVLLGDYVLSRCFELNSRLGRDDVSKLLCQTTGKVCRGEILQNLSRGDDLSESRYLEIIQDKTAEFFASCCEMGAMFNDAEVNFRRRLWEYGVNLGMAFQITDDLLDIEGGAARTGKSGERDMEQKKLTLPVIHAVNLGGDVRDRVMDAMGRRDGAAMREALRACGALEYAREKARGYCERAEDSLEPVTEKRSRVSLLALCEFVLTR